MARSVTTKPLARMTAIALVALASLSAGCGLLPEVKDETTGWSANKLYTEAKDAMGDGAYDKAAKLYEKLEARYPYGRYAQQAQIEIAYAYFKGNEQASAIAACDRFIKLHPEHPNVDYMYYLKGLANFNDDLGMMAYISMQDETERDPKGMREAFDAFRQLTVRFPESKYAKDAILRMKYLVNAMVSNEIHVARYYMKRGAYLAAVNRAQSVVLNYPETPAVEEALFIMIKGYDGMEMTDLRDDAERVMKKTFPDSIYYTQGLERKVPWWKLW